MLSCYGRLIVYSLCPTYYRLAVGHNGRVRVHVCICWPLHRLVRGLGYLYRVCKENEPFSRQL